MLTILHISLVMKIPKRANISTRDRGYTYYSRYGGEENKLLKHMNNLNSVFIVPRNRNLVVFKL